MEKNNKICAIICEYNPMHTGHTEQIKKIKEILGESTEIICLMSGNFTQRGEPAVLNKYDRTKIALQNGASLVVGFPTAFCTQSAEIFALSAIKILNNLKIDFLSFGMETPNMQALKALSEYLAEEPESFKGELKSQLLKGLNYNLSVKNSVLKNINLFPKNLHNDIKKILTYPNNILAVEYMKALIKTKSKIKPLIIRRDNNYNSKKLNQQFISSSLIRKHLNNFNLIENYLPFNCETYFKYKVDKKLFNKLALFSFKMKSATDLKKIYNVNEGLENRIKKNISLNDFNEFLKSISTKRYSENKLNRIFLNSLLDINSEIISKIYTIKSNIFCKVLGVKSEKMDIFSKINTKNLIIRKNDVAKINNNSYNLKLMEIENKANSLYNFITNTNLPIQDYFNKLIIC